MDKIKADKLRYQTNSSAYLLVMLSVVFSVISLFILITYDSYGTLDKPYFVKPDFRIGLEIVLGIVMMLVTFLAAEKVKFYSRIWGFYGLSILALINIVRIFNIPFYAFEKVWITERIRLISILGFAISAICLIIAAIITTRKIIVLTQHLKELNEYGKTEFN
jgi:amino acid transporter